MFLHYVVRILCTECKCLHYCVKHLLLHIAYCFTYYFKNLDIIQNILTKLIVNLMAASIIPWIGSGVLRIWLDRMRACQGLHCLFLNTLKMQLNCSALKPKHVRLGKCCCTPGFVRKKTFWPLWLLFTHVSLQSIRASPLGACRATSAIYSVCVFNTSTPVTCQRPHKLVNPIGFVWLLRAERLIVLMGGRKKARGKERKKRCWVDEWYLWSSDNVCKDLNFLIKF